MTYKACSRCGRIHRSNYQCRVNEPTPDTQQRRIRATYRWAQKAQQIKERANWLCEVCRDKGVYTYNELETHHIISLEKDSSLAFEDDNLICLCREHHEEAEQGKIDVEYLKKLARRREAR